MAFPPNGPNSNINNFVYPIGTNYPMGQAAAQFQQLGFRPVGNQPMGGQPMAPMGAASFGGNFSGEILFIEERGVAPGFGRGAPGQSQRRQHPPPMMQHQQQQQLAYQQQQMAVVPQMEVPLGFYGTQNGIPQGYQGQQFPMQQQPGGQMVCMPLAGGGGNRYHPYMVGGSAPQGPHHGGQGQWAGYGDQSAVPAHTSQFLGQPFLDTVAQGTAHPRNPQYTWPPSFHPSMAIYWEAPLEEIRRMVTATTISIPVGDPAPRPVVPGLLTPQSSGGSRQSWTPQTPQEMPKAVEIPHQRVEETVKEKKPDLSDLFTRFDEKPAKRDEAQFPGGLEASTSSATGSSALSSLPFSPISARQVPLAKIKIEVKEEPGRGNERREETSEELFQALMKIMKAHPVVAVVPVPTQEEEELQAGPSNVEQAVLRQEEEEPQPQPQAQPLPEDEEPGLHPERAEPEPHPDQQEPAEPHPELEEPEAQPYRQRQPKLCKKCKVHGKTSLWKDCRKWVGKKQIDICKYKECPCDDCKEINGLRAHGRRLQNNRKDQEEL